MGNGACMIGFDTVPNPSEEPLEQSSEIPKVLGLERSWEATQSVRGPINPAIRFLNKRLTAVTLRPTCNSSQTSLQGDM